MNQVINVIGHDEFFIQKIRVCQKIVPIEKFLVTLIIVNKTYDNSSNYG